MALTKTEALKFKWFLFVGKKDLYFSSDWMNKEYDLHIDINNPIGFRKQGDHYILIHGVHPEHRFKMRAGEYARILENCVGYSGKVGRVLVPAGVGGKDKPQKVKLLNAHESGYIKIPEVEVTKLKGRELEHALYNRPKKGLLHMDVSQSSNLKKVSWNPHTEIMWVEFRARDTIKGPIYAYPHVKRIEFEQMLNQPEPVKLKEGDQSHGTYFRAWIAYAKNYRRVD